jgi:hypothetical protein
MTTSTVAAAVDSLGAAFLSGRPDAVLDHFASSGDVVYAGSEPGEVAVGRAAIRSLLEALFGRSERYSWRTTGVSAAGTADTLYIVADADLFVHRSSESPLDPAGECFPYRISGVLEREGAVWRWRMCHGSEPTGA